MDMLANLINVFYFSSFSDAQHILYSNNIWKHGISIVNSRIIGSHQDNGQKSLCKMDITPPHSEEDGEGGKEECKDHNLRISD